MLRPREWRLDQPRRKGRLKCEFLIPIGVSDPETASDQVGRKEGRETPSPRRMRRISFIQTPLFTSLSIIKVFQSFLPHVLQSLITLYICGLHIRASRTTLIFQEV